jgi:hypothetical protein
MQLVSPNTENEQADAGDGVDDADAPPKKAARGEAAGAAAADGCASPGIEPAGTTCPLIAEAVVAFGMGAE